MVEQIVLSTIPNGQSRRRSNTGCWTCRLRRKKCDERQNQCMTCISLKLPCDGYGARPFWMDGGPLEKQKAAELKVEINKRRKRGRYKSGSRREPSAPCFFQPGSSDNTVSTPAIDCMSQNPRNLCSSRQDSIDAPSPTRSLEPRLMTQSSSAIDAGQYIWRQDRETDARMMNPNSISDESRFTVQQDSVSTDITTDPFEQASSPTLESADSTWKMFFDSGFPLECPQAADDMPDIDSAYGSIDVTPFIERNSLGSSPNFDDLLLAGTAVASTMKAAEDPVLTYYLDLVLPSVFPFMSGSVRTSFKASLRTMKDDSTQTLHLSSRAHGKYEQGQALAAFGIYASSQTEDDVSRWSGEAFNRVRSAIAMDHSGQVSREGSGRSSTIVNTALSVAQLTMLKIRQGHADYEQMSMLMELLICKCRSLAAHGDVLGNFICSVAVATDILASASYRRAPTLTSEIAKIVRLNIADLDLRQVCGCESWVFQYIAEATLIRTWKDKNLASRALNISELVRKATKLEEAMDKQYHDMKNREKNSYNDNGECTQITRVFFAATKIYIHVIVSGSHPEVSDICSAVDQTVEALKALSNATLVRQLAWPICIAASLAEPKHDDFFRSLTSGAQGDQNGCASVLRGLALAQESRRLRTASSSSTDTADWISAMAHLGQKWVLL